MTSDAYNLPAGNSSFDKEKYVEHNNPYDQIKGVQNSGLDRGSHGPLNDNDLGQSAVYDTVMDEPQNGIYANAFFGRKKETETNKNDKEVVKRKFILASFVLSLISFALIVGMFIMFFSFSNAFFEDQSEFHNEVRKQLMEMQNNTMKQIDQLNISINILQQGFIELGDGWVSPFNGYQYKLVKTEQNWATARSTCHNMGGDLASFGIRNIITRKILKKTLNFLYVWIGLNDISSEGTWRYITNYPSNDGDLASNSLALWGHDQPETSTDHDCAYMYHSDLLSYSFDCSGISSFLCEKPL